MAWAGVVGSRVVVVVEVVGAPDALWGQIESGGGTGAGLVIAYGGTEFAVGVATAVDDVRAGIADGWLEWRTGLGAGIGGVGAEAGKSRGWAGVAGGAERWREEAEACGAAEEGG